MEGQSNHQLQFTEAELNFIEEKEHLPLTEIALLRPKFPQLRFDKILQQIKGRNKANKKLPLWYANRKIIYPASISLEQCSSIETANFKSNLLSGDTIVDITGGMGIDIYHCSTNFKHAVYCEIQEELARITEYNFKQLDSDIQVYQGSGIDFLKENTKPLDCIYLDPARRDNENKRVFLLEDCTPNIIEIEDFLLEKADLVMVKCAPMLDIHLALQQLSHVQKLYIVSLNNECKELLFILGKEGIKDIPIHCINLTKQGKEEFQFNYKDEIESQSNIGDIGQYIYLPNSSILKAGAFKLLTKRFNINKIAINSHLYSSDLLIKDFPGRTFKIERKVEPNLKKLKKYLKGLKRELIVRNYPLKTNQLQQNLNIQTGSDSHYLIFTQNENSEKLIYDCIKVN